MLAPALSLSGSARQAVFAGLDPLMRDAAEALLALGKLSKVVTCARFEWRVAGEIARTRPVFLKGSPLDGGMEATKPRATDEALGRRVSRAGLAAMAAGIDHGHLFVGPGFAFAVDHGDADWEAHGPSIRFYAAEPGAGLQRVRPGEWHAPPAMPLVEMLRAVAPALRPGERLTLPRVRADQTAHERAAAQQAMAPIWNALAPHGITKQDPFHPFMSHSFNETYHLWRTPADQPQVIVLLATLSRAQGHDQEFGGHQTFMRVCIPDGFAALA